MRVLFDRGTPVPLRRSLRKHEVTTAHERGWSTLKNGDLLAAAAEDGFEVLVTTDSNLRHQQDVAGRPFGIVVLRSTSWPRIRQAIPAVIAAIDGATPGTYQEIDIPAA